MKKVMGIAMASVLSTCILVSPTTSLAAAGSAQWVKGDFHTHTYLSDGSYKASEVAEKAKKYGLDWYSAADHGGGTVGTRDQNGNPWVAGTENAITNDNDITIMPRWASIYGIGEDMINENRKTGILQFSGFELNVPGHEHASVGMIGDSATVKKDLAVFDYMYDATNEVKNLTIPWLTDLARDMDGKGETSAKRTNNTHNGALDAAAYLQADYQYSSYFLPNHPSRQLKFQASDFKEMNDIAPDVCFGAELLPGHQASAFRGGFGYFTYYSEKSNKYVNLSKGSAATLEEMVDNYIAAQADPTAIDDKAVILSSLKSCIAKQRTYGGADYMLAKVGGAWDTLLSEGRHFWIFGNSDFHLDTVKASAQSGSEPDFWPGEYTKNYTYASSKTYKGILSGMRSGNTFVTLGDLINKLDFKIKNNTSSAAMGKTLDTIKNQSSIMTVTFKSPAKNNNNQKPVVNHVDLIAGEVKGIPEKYVDSSQVNVPNLEDPNLYLTDAYKNSDVSAATKVIKRFYKKDWKTDKNGNRTITFKLPKTTKDMFYRLRGSNNALNTQNVDAKGNPTIDTAVDMLVGSNTPEKAYGDLWFYSNPIFVNKPIDGVTVRGTLKNKAGKVMKNQKIEIDQSGKTITTTSKGAFNLNNINIKEIHTIDLKNASGKTTASFSFKISRKSAAGFSKGDVYVGKKASIIKIDFKLNGKLKITKVSKVK